MAEILTYVSIVSFVLAGISFLIAVFLWFYFKIPTVYGDLSGKTAKKSIAQMRENNEKKTYLKKNYNSKNYESKNINKLGKEKSKNSNSEKLSKEKTKSQNIEKPSKEKSKNQNVEKSVKEKNKKDEIFKNNKEVFSETELLSSNKAENIVESKETELLKEETPETELLTETINNKYDDKDMNKKTFKMIDDIVLIHSNELIE